MPLDKKQQEEKEAYAQKIMAEMKLKNEKLQERYREVQRDRERAEERNSSITTGRNQKREADRDIAPRAKYEREWDRGKPNPDAVEWDSSEHHDYYSRNTRNFSDRRYKKDDSWRSRTTNSSNNPTSSFFSKYNKNDTIPESSTFRNDASHFNGRSRSQFYSTNPIKGRANNESNYENSKFHDHSRKFSAPQIHSESKRAPAQHSMNDGIDELMWQCGSMNEVQHKLSRIENWVKSININHGFADSSETMNKKEEYKSQVKRKDLGFQRERPKKCGSVEDSNSKRSKEPTHLRAKEKSEHKFNTSFSRGRGNRMLAGDRCSSVSDSKNQKDGKRKNLNERSRRKCESDMSDRASSMKESDDPDWGKDKVIRARSNSKSSENSCNRGKRIHISEEPSTDLTDSHNFGNWKSGELNKFETDEKHEETSKQSVLKQNFLDDDECDYGSKSLPSYGDSGNYEFESPSHQRQSFKKANNKCKKNSKFCKNEVESGLAFSKKSGVQNRTVFETVSKPRNIHFPDVRSNDFVEYDQHNFTKNDKEVRKNSNNSDGECPRITSSVFGNSFFKCDMKQRYILNKNLKSAENITVALQCNPKDSLTPNKRNVSVKRYSHKKTRNITVKLPRKSKLPLDVKVTDEAMGKKINTESCAKDSNYDLETNNKDLNEPDVKLVPEEKQGLSDDIKLDTDRGDVAAPNSSDEWVTDDEGPQIVLLSD